jgi:uncharacterized protein YfaS (alpha-2-macroglobulin family)
MAGQRASRWLFPWVPLGFVTALVAGVVALLMATHPAQQAQGAASSLQAAAGFQDKDKFLLTVNLPAVADGRTEGKLTLELLAADGEVLHKTSRTVKLSEQSSSQRIEMPLFKTSTDKVTVRCTLDKDSVKAPLSQIMLVKAHETAVSSSQEFFAGSTAALRCSVHGVKSIAETIPLSHASVEVHLKDKNGKRTQLYKGSTADNGIASARMQLPAELPAGNYKLEVVTKSTLGEEKLERDVKVKTAPKILLISDKPLYQPGQTMHLRALSLQSYDLTPVGNLPLTFEVEDAKGNKVFKRTLTTSDHGIASVDFVLASEVNTGDYQIRAQLGDVQSAKTVTVKPYVLPKFKSELKADKRFYLPKETLNGDLQVDYFFGKPVAGAQVTIKASTFDVAFKDFQTWQGKTDAQGHAKFEIKLPDYFVGQPLDKGNALVRLEAKVIDTADHSEIINKTYPVSNQSVQFSLIPEGGRLVPNMENRIFAAAIYPDGSPAQADVSLWQGQKAEGKTLAALKTNEAGLAEFKFTPKADMFRQGEFAERKIEMLGGNTVQAWAPKQLLDLTAKARDAKGNQAQTMISLTSEPLGENVLLRLDKAIYKGGEALKVKIHTSAGLPTVYFDVVRGGQTLLTQWLDVKDGVAEQTVELPASVFGTLDVHAYQMLGHGEIIRDSRVVYVNPASDLKIEIKADKDVYLPGDKGNLNFQVRDAQGKPTAAALGVIIVDEAVYALQEMQPGLEKVYFTLQEELLKPQAHILYKPSQRIDDLVREPVLADAKQQAAEVLFTSIKPQIPARWEVDPSFERQRAVQGQMQNLGMALFDYAHEHEFLVQGKDGKWAFTPDLREQAIKKFGWNEPMFKDSLGGQLTLDAVVKLEKHFTAEELAKAVTWSRMQQLESMIIRHASNNQAKWLIDGEWTFPADIVEDAVKASRNTAFWGKDAWGKPIRLVKRDKKRDHQLGNPLWDFHELVSAGPDGKFDTADDVTTMPARQRHLVRFWWVLADESRLVQVGQGLHRRGRERFLLGLEQDRAGKDGRGEFPEVGNFFDRFDQKAEAKGTGGDAKPGADPKGAPTTGPAGAAPVVRTREYFPETMLWQPALITDDRGRASLPLNFADSITTWRLTASASSRGGLLGGTTTSLRVFQDFFADIDLPVSLTRNDEVAFPVAVYNYLKTPQTVKLELQAENWFELTDGLGLTRSLDLQPGQVTAVKFRIRAKQIGQLPLTVKAIGSKMSDSLKRSIEVVPDGKRIEQVFADRLNGRVNQTITIPDNALPDASKLLVKVYPGVFSQLVEGTEGMLRMPGGCFEQTSSSAYPNVLVVDYIKKAKVASPAVLMTAEQYLNVGYQRLLTFERPGGGFDWWGSGEPLVWLSAYGLSEFNDMARVYPIDRGVIERTQKWLMKQRAEDGTWDKIGATHGESIERMGDPKLLLTSYVVWSLLDSGLKTPELNKSIEYIRKGVKDAENPYILALAANALASWDSKDDSTFEAVQKTLRKLESKKQVHEEWKAISFPAGGHSLSYARGDSLTVETTALAVLAMQKSGQFTTEVNKALMYLVKSKDAHGTWGSTQATILALKALISGMGGSQHKGKVEFAILVNGKEAARGEVTEENADVMQLFDLKEHTQRAGVHNVTIEVKGETNLMYQVVARHFEGWGEQKIDKPLFDVSVDYDRTRLQTSDLLKATAKLTYNGKEPTSMVMLELGVPPGFTVDAGDFAELVAAKKVNKFSVTARQVILYLGDVKPGDVQKIEYSLKPKYPIKAKTPATVVYEYYTPANRAEAKPVELVVEEKK